MQIDNKTTTLPRGAVVAVLDVRLHPARRHLHEGRVRRQHVEVGAGAQDVEEALKANTRALHVVVEAILGRVAAIVKEGRVHPPVVVGLEHVEAAIDNAVLQQKGLDGLGLLAREHNTLASLGAAKNDIPRANQLGVVKNGEGRSVVGGSLNGEPGGKGEEVPAVISVEPLPQAAIQVVVKTGVNTDGEAARLHARQEANVP